MNESDKWIRALQNVVRMVYERAKMNGDESPSMRSSVLDMLGMNESCRVVRDKLNLAVDDISDELIVSDDTLVLLDHPHSQRDQKYKYTGSRTAIALSGSGNGISGCHETFHVDRMQLCLVDHALYCPHKRLVGQERQAIVYRFGADFSKYPKLPVTDPVVRFFGWPIQTLVEIRVEDVPQDMQPMKYRVVWNVDDA
jgi:DNA-directed RNA polymerase subunit H (RpoH/RPB5)